MSLDLVNLNEDYVIKSVNLNYKEKRRLYDLGILPNVTIKKVLTSFFNEPSAYEVKGTTISIRREVAEKIEVSNGK